MSIKKSGLYLLLVCLTFPLHAHDLWTGTKKIVSVQVLSDGGLMVNLDSEIHMDCLHAGTSTLLISPNKNGVTNNGARSLLSTALIAFSTGSDINILYSNDTVYCWGNSLLISKKEPYQPQ